MGHRGPVLKEVVDWCANGVTNARSSRYHTFRDLQLLRWARFLWTLWPTNRRSPRDAKPGLTLNRPVGRCRESHRHWKLSWSSPPLILNARRTPIPPRSWRYWKTRKTYPRPK